MGNEELSPVVGETEGLLTQTDEPDIKNALFSFVVSIEPAEEPIEQAECRMHFVDDNLPRDPYSLILQ